MKHLILVIVIFFTLNYCTNTLAQQIDDEFKVQGRGRRCTSVAVGGRCRRLRKSCGYGFEEAPPAGPHCRRGRRKCCVPRQAAIFVGPYINVWDEQCSLIEDREGTTVSECKLLCTREPDCTAINVGEDYGYCDLRSCPWPVPVPETNHHGFKGYAIAAVCGTDSKCGIKGGFCIPENEECNGNTIKEEGYCNANYKGMGCKCCFTPTVYMKDIENTIAYAFRNRMVYDFWGTSYRNDISSSEQNATKDFIQVLMEKLPLREPLKNFLSCIQNFLPTAKLSGKSLEERYEDCEENSDNQLPYVTSWVVCRNTNDPRIQQLRSYPCGIWITFHAISVGLTDEDSPQFVLRTLHEIVRYFPWCTDCRGHFMKMYKNLNGVGMTTAEDVTMWLWRAHNKVSVRVADGFDGPHKTTYSKADCQDITPPKVERLQSLLSACKFQCKMRMDPEDCNFINVPSAENPSACTFCKRRTDNQKNTIYPASMRYNLNTAPENPGRRKSLFPEFKLCPDCWNLVIPGLPYTDFKTNTKTPEVLGYLRMIYSHNRIIGNPSMETFACNPPCINGECTSEDTCECPPGWEGALCQEFDCDPGCQNGGTCTGPNECKCTEDSYGDVCQYT